MEGTPLAMSPLKSMLRQKRNYENSDIRQGQKEKSTCVSFSWFMIFILIQIKFNELLKIYK
jgi:hypothetical protein